MAGAPWVATATSAHHQGDFSAPLVAINRAQGVRSRGCSVVMRTSRYSLRLYWRCGVVESTSYRGALVSAFGWCLRRPWKTQLLYS